MSDTKYRVYNRCKFDIGCTLLNDRNVVIKPGNFQMLTQDDILYVDSSCSRKKFFADKMLVAVDENGNDVPLEKMGIVEGINLHYGDDEIQQMLKQSVKKIEAWLATIEDPIEIHSIIETAKAMDLPASKLKLLQEKAPQSELI